MFHVIGSITDAARGSEAARTHPVSIVAAPIGWVGGPGLPTGAATVVWVGNGRARDRVNSASLRFIPVRRELFPSDVKLFSSSRMRASPDLRGGGGDRGRALLGGQSTATIAPLSCRNYVKLRRRRCREKTF
jgi:hypothetical protein